MRPVFMKGTAVAAAGGFSLAGAGSALAAPRAISEPLGFSAPVAANPLVSTVLPGSLADGFTVSGSFGPVHLSVSGASAQPGSVLRPGEKEYPASPTTGEILLSRSGAGSVQLRDVLSSSAAPQGVRLTVTNPGANVEVTRAGSLIIAVDGVDDLSLPAPTARAADGAPVNARYVIDGPSTYTIAAEARAGTKYPVVLDPWYRRWFGWTYVLTPNQTAAIAAGLGAAAAAAKFGDIPGWVVSAAATLAATGISQLAADWGECLAINYADWGVFPGISGC